MKRTFALVPNEKNKLEPRHVNQIIESWLGKTDQGVPLKQVEVDDPDEWAGDFRNKDSGGKHLRVKHSTEENTVLFQVTNEGVRFSVDGQPYTNGNPFIYPGMIVLWDTDEAVPAGWKICDGSVSTPDIRGRFVLHPNGDAARGTSGGLNDHLHQVGAHAHPLSAHDHDVPSHQHTIAKSSFNHSHDGETGPADDGLTNSFESGDALAGTANEYALRPHTHNITQSLVAGDGNASTNGTSGHSPSGSGEIVGGSTAFDTTSNSTAFNSGAKLKTDGGAMSAADKFQPFYAAYYIRRMVG